MKKRKLNFSWIIRNLWQCKMMSNSGSLNRTSLRTRIIRKLNLWIFGSFWYAWINNFLRRFGKFVFWNAWESDGMFSHENHKTNLQKSKNEPPAFFFNDFVFRDFVFSKGPKTVWIVCTNLTGLLALLKIIFGVI